MDFETIEIFLVCYLGNWNMKNLSFRNTSDKSKRLIAYDL